MNHGRVSTYLTAGALAAACTLALGLGCSHGADPDPAEGSMLRPLDADARRAEGTSLAASAVVAELRERFRVASPAGSRPVLPPGEAERFAMEPDGRLVARLTDGARHSSDHLARVELPARADGWTRLTDRRSGISIAWTLDHGRSTAVELAEGLAVYAAAAPAGGHVVLRPHLRGVEDYVVLERRPARAELSYRIDVAAAAGLRLVDDVLEFLDEHGTPRVRMGRPYLIDREGRRHAATVTVDDCAVDRDRRGPWRRTVTPPGATHCSAQITWVDAAVQYPALLDPPWETAGSMSAQRTGHDLLTLPSGLVMAAGGFSSAVDLYDPNTNTWSPTGALSGFWGAAKLALVGAPPDKVLVVGGNGNAAAFYDLDNPNVGWTATPDMASSRDADATATSLADGMVLVVGGTDDSPLVELFDPSRAVNGGFVEPNGFAKTVSRKHHTATRLDDGRVLVTGGELPNTTLTPSAEIYDHATQGWSLRPAMSEARGWHAASRLPSGGVLISGGVSCAAGCDTSNHSEIYDPVADSWSDAGSLSHSRYEHVSIALSSGWVMVAGGRTCDPTECVMLTSVELWAPTGGWSLNDHWMDEHRTNLAATLVDDMVLVAGGNGCAGQTCVIHASAERYRPAANGTPCTLAGECASGVCQDGVCCDEACTSACHACTAALKGSGEDGVCGAVAAGADPRGVCSDQGPSSCGQVGPCADGGECELYATGTECAPAECSAELFTRSACDGQGVCTPASITCAPYAYDCDAFACLDSCSDDEDCVAGSRCDTDTGSCLNSASCDGDHTATTATGETVDCSPYKCTPAGECRLSCDSNDDCVAGLVCDRDHRCVPNPANTTAADDGSCGCRLPGRAPQAPRHGGWLALLSIAALTARRRRRPAPSCQR